MKYEVHFPDINNDDPLDRQMVIDVLRNLAEIVTQHGFVAQVLISSGQPKIKLPIAYVVWELTDEEAGIRG